MANWVIEKKGALKGEIDVPPDKSISHRAVILSSIAQGKSRVKNWLRADDVMRTIRAFQELGVEIKINNELIISGEGKHGLKPPQNPLDMGNSGTGLRLLAGVLAGQKFLTILTGDETLKKRPMRRIIEPLSKMGAKIEAEDGEHPPLRIQGGDLKGIKYTLPVASAQVKSAILLASLYATGKTKITEPAPSRDHTERMLEFFGARIKKSALCIEMDCGQNLEAREIEVVGDISSASFFLVAGCLVKGSEVLVKNVGINPTRAGILEVLKEMGADIKLLNQRNIAGEPVADILVKSSPLRAVEIKGEIIPRLIDEIPVLAVAGAVAQGTTIIRDAKELRVKESDRIHSTVSELKKMGAKIEELEDGMIIEGPCELKGAEVYSHKDHRVAMSLAVAGLYAQGKTIIKEVQWVETSFPDFFNKLNQLVA